MCLSHYDLHFLRKRPSAAFSEMVNDVVNTVYQAAKSISNAIVEMPAGVGRKVVVQPRIDKVVTFGEDAMPPLR